MIHRWKGLRKLNPNDPLGLLYSLTGSRNSRWRTPDRNNYLKDTISDFILPLRSYNNTDGPIIINNIKIQHHISPKTLRADMVLYLYVNT